MNKFKLLIVSAVLALSACDGAAKSSTKKSMPSEAVATSVPVRQSNLHHYVVGGELNFVPFGFRDEHGQPTGFELELLKEVAKAGHFEVDIINIKRSGLIDFLNKDQLQIGASSLTITPERLEKIDMSDPYMAYENVIYVLDKGNGLKINTLLDLKGKRIAYHRSSKASLATATELSGSVDNAIAGDSVFLSLKEMYAGKADAVIGDARVFQYYLKNYPEFKGHSILINQHAKPTNFGFAVRKGNHELLQKINDGLAKVKANGTLDALMEKWFGKQAPKK